LSWASSIGGDSVHAKRRAQHGIEVSPMKIDTSAFSSPSLENRLAGLKRLKDEELITGEDYQSQGKRKHCSMNYDVGATVFFPTR